MAERSVNIRINYVVNTADVIRAQAASNAAQKSTDNLRKATEEYSKVASKAFKPVPEDLKKTQTELDKTAKEFNNLYNTVRTFLTAGIAKQILDIALNMATLSGQVEGVSKAFNRLPASTLLLNDLRKATHGTVTDLELMQKALQASNFKIPLEKLGTLFEFAATKAQQTGQEVNHLVDYIVSGIGYRSIKRLDDLGFTANRVKDALGGVSLQAASMGQVMDAVTKLMSEDLQKTGGYADTSATAVSQLKNEWTELGKEVAKSGTSGGFIAYLKEVVSTFRVIAAANFDYKNIPIVLALEQVNKLAIDQADAFRKRNDQLKEGERLLGADKELFNLAKTIQQYKEQKQFGTERIEILRKEIEQLTEKNKSLVGLQKLGTEEAKQIKEKEKEIVALQRNNDALISNIAVVSEAIKITEEYRQSIASTNEEEFIQLGLIESVEEKLSDLKDNLKTARSIEEIANLNNEILVLEKTLTRLKDSGVKDNQLFGSEKTSKKKVEALVDRNQLVDVAKQIEQSLNSLPAPIKPKIRPFIPPDEWDKIANEFSKNWQNLVSDGINNVASVIDSSIQAQADQYDVQLNQLRAFYDEQINLAGNNEKVKKELEIKRDREERQLRQKAFEADKESKRLQTIVNGAAAVINAFATLPYPAAIVASIAIAGETATQLAIISQTQFKGYKDGVLNLQGPGTERSDSIPAMLSKGESVMTAEQTKRSLGILQEIKAGRLDDRIIRNIDFSGGRAISANLNDERIVRELKAIKNSQYSLEEQGRRIYKHYTDDNGNKRKIRAKNM